MASRITLGGEKHILDSFTSEMALRVEGLAHHRNFIIEERIRLLLNPKPRWWPAWFWRSILHRALTHEVWNRMTKDVPDA